MSGEQIVQSVPSLSSLNLIQQPRIATAVRGWLVERDHTV